ncbi:uncharacterized protein LOC113362014 [Papaver somniferum]|uniref:uncharacterized protein LOC113362014 n=1 Tax=Papaver somniferum TaxID=3469 RepID=UPI000E6FD5DF|nr:uncharacterized protein LOC113362014 [Papaver somniferum]
MLKKEAKKIVIEKQDNSNFSWVSFHDNYDDDDEALSLCVNNQQFSLSDSPDKDRNENDDVLRINTTTTANAFDEELFEFFSDFNSGMKAAEDIIYCGKLLPYSSPESENQSNQPRRLYELELEEKRLIEADFNKKCLYPHRKCSSLNELQKSQPKRALHKNYSSDYQKLQRTSDSKNTSAATTSRAWKQENTIYDGNKCFRKNVLSCTPSLSSKKQVALFGVMKAPAEMELTDIRYRQNKRNLLASWTTVHPGEKTNYAKNNGRKNSWSVLGALGCKGQANAVVTTSLRCLPHV